MTSFKAMMFLHNFFLSNNFKILLVLTDKVAHAFGLCLGHVD